MTPINQSTISLRLFGKNLDPVKITKELKCTPTSSAKMGEAITNRAGKTRLAKEGFWRLEYGEINAIDLGDKIDQLLEKMSNDLEIWKEITTDCRADLFCGLFMKKINEGLVLPPEILKKISNRNLKLSLDIYSTPNHWYDKQRLDDNNK